MRLTPCTPYAQSLRGLLVCLRRMAARGAAVSELLAAALALSGYRAALLQAEAEGAGRRAASSKKKTVAEGGFAGLQRGLEKWYRMHWGYVEPVGVGR